MSSTMKRNLVRYCCDHPAQWSPVTLSTHEMDNFAQ